MVAFHLIDGFVQILFKQRHNRLHLVCRTFPVFRGKRVDCQILDTEILAVGRNAAERLRACRVAHFARQPALFCPASVAVHDDGDMPRERVVVFHDKSLSRQKPPSGGFLSAQKPGLLGNLVAPAASQSFGRIAAKIHVCRRAVFLPRAGAPVKNELYFICACGRKLCEALSRA